MDDWYLQDLSRLNKTPKRTIAEYVRSEGFMVPRIFDSVKESKKYSYKKIFRSELEQDYAGVSGLAESIVFSNEKLSNKNIDSISDFKREYLSHIIDSCHENIDYYCEYNDISKEDFGEELDFTMWEYIQGSQCMVVGDNTVPNRHFVIYRPERSIDKNFVVFDNKKPTYFLDEK